jgi:hypothetical protein
VALSELHVLVGCGNRGVLDLQGAGAVSWPRDREPRVTVQQRDVELPRYRCHQEVWALNIEEVRSNPAGTRMIAPADRRFTPFVVSAQFVARHSPRAGGYILWYADGNMSFVPAPVFEKGYSPASA